MVALFDEAIRSTAYLPSRTDDAVAFVTERIQARRDALADAQDERRDRIERSVTLSDLLEELEALESKREGLFMFCLARGNRDDRHWLYCELEAAKERIIARRLAQGD